MRLHLNHSYFSASLRFVFNRKGAERTSKKCVCTLSTGIFLLLFLCVSAVCFLTAKAQRSQREFRGFKYAYRILGFFLLLFLCVSAVLFFNRKGAEGTSEKCVCSLSTGIFLLLFLCVSAVCFLTAKAQRSQRELRGFKYAYRILGFFLLLFLCVSAVLFFNRKGAKVAKRISGF